MWNNLAVNLTWPCHEAVKWKDSRVLSEEAIWVCTHAPQRVPVFKEYSRAGLSVDVDVDAEGFFFYTWLSVVEEERRFVSFFASINTWSVKSVSRGFKLHFRVSCKKKKHQPVSIPVFLFKELLNCTGKKYAIRSTTRNKAVFFLYDTAKISHKVEKYKNKHQL